MVGDVVDPRLEKKSAGRWHGECMLWFVGLRIIGMSKKLCLGWSEVAEEKDYVLKVPIT